MIVLVIGGSGSGKSAYAEKLVKQFSENKRVYIATMRVWDHESRYCQIDTAITGAPFGFIERKRYDGDRSFGRCNHFLDAILQEYSHGAHCVCLYVR